MFCQFPCETSDIDVNEKTFIISNVLYDKEQKKNEIYKYVDMKKCVVYLKRFSSIILFYYIQVMFSFYDLCTNKNCMLWNLDLYQSSLTTSKCMYVMYVPGLITKLFQGNYM